MTDLSPGLQPQTRHSNSAEVPLHASEIFFSRTDSIGVLRSGNDVFKRVSGYSEEELYGQPHKIVRHDDTPRGLFQLLWNRLNDGRPMGFYIKNTDKSGRFYWVFALASPVDDGFMSIRIKPSSTHLDVIKKIYARMRKAEKEDNVTPQESARALQAHVRELGFASYEAYQSTVFAAEIEGRLKQLGESPDQMQKRIMAMAAAIAQVETETAEMTEAFKAIRTVPMNMRIIASRLESAGGPISAISVNYSQMLEEMSTWVKTFVEGESCVFARIRNAILNGQFLALGIIIAKEMSDAAERSAETGELTQTDRDDIAALAGLRASYQSETAAALNSVETEAMRFGRSVLDMKRYVTGLSSTRMMCKIESASLSNSGTALSGIVDQLDACQNEIEERLARIVELNSVIQSNTSMLRSYF